MITEATRVERQALRRRLFSVLVKIGGRLALRLVAVGVLLLGIVVMHHVAQPDHDAAAQQPSAAAAHGMDQHDAGAAGSDNAGGHELLHLCMAVLVAAVVLVAGWLLLAWRRLPAPVRPAWCSARRVQTRPPARRYGSSLLLSLCVMRT